MIVIQIEITLPNSLNLFRKKLHNLLTLIINPLQALKNEIRLYTRLIEAPGIKIV